MASLRRRLRLCTTTWLVFQVVWLAALVPRDCCAAHRPAEKSCHESAPAAHHRSAPLSPPTDCRLGGACDGPMAALFALLSNHGILPESATVIPEPALRSAGSAIDQNAIGRFETPDPPPPRV